MLPAMVKPRSEERRVGKECRYWRDWSSDVCSSDLPWLPGVIHLIYCCFNRFPLSHFHWLSICFPKLLEQKRPFPVCRPNGGTCSTELRLANLLLECYQPW